MNAYVDEPRMTQDVDLISTRAADVAEEIRARLNKAFTIAVRVREVVEGKGYRVYQIREPKNRHLVDVCQVEALPSTRLVADIHVPTPEELIAQKVIAYTRRKDQPKGGTDLRDLMVLLLAFPNLQSPTGPVLDRLQANQADEPSLATWRRMVESKIDPGETEGD